MNEFLRWILYLPEQATTLAKEIDQLHYWVIGSTMGGATLVAIAALWWAFRYRAKAPDELTPQVQGGLALELSFIGGLAALFLLFWVVGFNQYLRIRIPPKDGQVIYVTGKQWMWKFAYPEGKQTIATLVVPARERINLIMTSRDVIHSFYVPAFRIKQDVLPGRYETMWFEAKRPGLYKIFCAEYCGTGHSQMWGDVVVLDAEAYQLWLEGEPLENLIVYPPGEARRVISTGRDAKVPDYPRAIAEQGYPRSMADRGLEVAAEKGCLSCHTLDGQPHLGPTWRGLWYRQVQLVTGERVVADEAYLTRSMMDPGFQVVVGFGNIMPSYQGLLEPGEVGAILELIRTLADPLPDPDRYPEPLVDPPTAPLHRVDPKRADESRREAQERRTP